MLNGERYKRIKRNLEQQPTSNDKYDGIKKSIMALSVSLNLTFSALFCITCFFFRLHHSFSFSIKWLVVTFPVALVAAFPVSVMSVRIFFFISTDAFFSTRESSECIQRTFSFHLNGTLDITLELNLVS